MKKALIGCALILITNLLYAQTNIFPATGNVGIGTTTPGAELSFKSITVGTEAVGITWYSTSPQTYGIHRTLGTWVAPDYQQLRASWSTGIVLDPGSAYGKSYVDIVGGGLRVTSGNVGIGTVDTKGYKLAVNGNIRAKEVKVETANWPDYVFAKNYRLPSLTETENHIREKGHLPGIPSAEEVKINGIDLGEMNAKLLQKIEELTLHLIASEKRNSLQNKKQQDLIEQQQRDIRYLKSKIK
ncbi:hypothetical protein [Pedobacter sp. B4-66]|uniref:hypothetical protein n=1 Tax=Pedobacter sp. B4-66 TaxID=2817280 RepID=UPI001BDB1976|nr:hypothetical protein [Pedobacter sp. B4-66]